MAAVPGVLETQADDCLGNGEGLRSSLPSTTQHEMAPAPTHSWLREEAPATSSEMRFQNARSFLGVSPQPLHVHRITNNALSTSVDAVVSRILPESVLLRCVGVDVELSLPPSVVPEELQIYGAPVRVTLGNKGHIRAPIVEARLAAEKTALPGERELDALVEAL